MIRSSVVAVVVAVSLLATRVDGATTMPKPVLRCRKILAKSFAQMIDTGLDVLATCHDKRRPSRDCNVLAGVPAFERARARAKGIANAFCAANDPVLENYPIASGDVVEPVSPVMARRIEASGQALQAATAATDRATRRCEHAIGQSRRKIIARMVRDALHCQRKRDAESSMLGAIAADCVGDGSNDTLRWRAKITKACAEVASGTVGTCSPLPDCAITSIVATGQELERDIYGARGDLCGNGELDAGEQCDDGNRDDNDACTNLCTTARCGDGSVETGVEQCDDGNTDETDACTPRCELARCGDGIVEKGVEQCDDGAANGTAGDACQADCTFPQIACSASGRIDLIATLVPKRDHSTFTDPNGITLTTAYPSSASIPGSGTLSPDDPSDPAAHIVLLDPDLYSGFFNFNDSDTALTSLVVLPSGSTFSVAADLPFERVSFDCAQGTLFNAGQFQCAVTDEADKLGGTIAPNARPDCSLMLTSTP